MALQTINVKYGALNFDGNIIPAYTTGNLTIGNVANPVGNVITSTELVTANLYVGGNIMPSAANATVGIGSPGNWFGTVYGTAYNAKYADLAEKYIADANYEPGTVLMFGGPTEVTIADQNTTRVAGVVSTNPATVMNGELEGTNVVTLALTGRVPCKVIGPVAKGDLLVSAGFGYARTDNGAGVGQIVGRAVNEYVGTGKAVIEVAVL